MKRIFTLLFATSIALFITSFSVHAQIYYNFETATPTTNSYANITADTVSQGNNNGVTQVRNSTSPSSGYTGSSGANNAGAAARTGGFVLATSTYFEVILTPTAGNSVVLTGISFGSRSTGTGPQNASIRSSVDAFSTDLATFTLATTSSWALYSNTISVTGIAGVPVTLRIYGYNGAGSPGANTANWRIDDLTINPNVTLPLTLTSFKASLSNTGVQLNWVSANEQNFDGYSIEKSFDGRSFSSLGTVAAANKAQTSYSFIDAKPFPGVNYYRLKLNDKDGSLKYSSVVVVNNRAAFSVSLFPNPVISNLSITHTKANKNAFIKILSADGRIIKSTTISEGAIQTSITVGDLVKGSYILEFNNNGEKSFSKFVKQ